MYESINVFARLDYNVKRGLRKIYSIHSFSRKDWIEIKNYFNHRCAFCGKKEDGTAQKKLVKDHLYPAIQNGDYVKGNIVSSCSTCNDRRGNQIWSVWLKNNYPNKYKVRSLKIKNYIKKYNYINHPINIRMTKKECEKYNEILISWNNILKRSILLRKQIINKRNIK